MQKTIIIFLLIQFASSIFTISVHYASPTKPAFYAAVVSCIILVYFTLIQKFKQQTFNLSVSEIILASFLLFSIVYVTYSGGLNPEWIISALSLGLFYLVVKRIYTAIEWVFIGLVFIGIVQSIYGLGQYWGWFTNIAASSFRMSGSFDNPAGFAATLSVCFPFALFLLLKK